MRRGIVYVMAKLPVAGQVKTRLCPPLAPEAAALLAAAFAADTMEKLSRVEHVEVRLAIDGAAASPGSPCRLSDRGGASGMPQSSKPANGWLPESPVAVAARLGMAVETQGDGDLGVRMERLLLRGLDAGSPTVLLGTDSPDSPPGVVAAAFDALERRDVAIAPATDGGYWLIGARTRVDGLFRVDAPWGSDRVFEETVRALAQRGVPFETLPAWDDVDDAAALGRLADRLEKDGPAVAAATACLIRLWRREGVRF